MAIPIARHAFITFLINAKRQTYAAQGDEATVTPLLPGAHQLEYREGTLLYRDIYLGSAYFVGQETVYYGISPVWAMGYAGGVITDVVAPAEVYRFLRAVLRQINPKHPYRGPSTFCEDPYAYTNKCHGDLERFWGVEAITHKGHRVYELRYGGGLLR